MRHPRFSLLVMALIATGCAGDAVMDPSDDAASLAQGGGPPRCAGIPKWTRAIVLAPANSEVAVGDSVTITAANQDGVVIPDCALQWLSTDPATATVSGTGVVLGVSIGGPVTITAQTRGKKRLRATALVTVRAADVPLASLQLVYGELVNTDLSIYAMNGDGTGRRFVNVGTGPTQHDNLILARGAWQDNRIYAMNEDGSNRREILPSGPSYVPDLAPDGQRFALMYGDCGGGHPLATANIDGSGLNLLPVCTSTPPRWSPLGDRIAYSLGATIYTINVDGTDIRAVTTLASTELTSLAWSPDGASLLFTWRSTSSAYWSIYRINSDGSQLRQMTSEPADDFVQDWSAEGDWILFFSTRSGSMALWAMRIDGSDATNLVAIAGQEGAKWRR